MSSTDTLLHSVVNCDRYPLHQPDSLAWDSVIAGIQRDLATDGCSVLKDFIHPTQLPALAQQGQQLAPDAYYTVSTVNVYNTDPNQDYPPDHPGRITFERGNAFVARDRIPTDYLISQLYTHAHFKAFITRCFAVDTLYELADPLAGLCLNVLQTDREHPWHFDTNEFTVSLLTQAADHGGEFQFFPDIRSPDAENQSAVHDVITGKTPEVVKHLNLACGDLQLFKGRYALHRVSPVKGAQERHTAIFAYTPVPDVISNVERTRQLFGRVLPEHYASEKNAQRRDQLID